MSFVLIFDIPREKPVLALRVNRQLKRMGAAKFQHSVWRSEDLGQLMRIALMIRRHGGKAAILEERFVFS